MVNENEIMFKGNPEIVYPKAPGRGLSFKCFKCPSIFDRKEALITHSSLHGSGKKFRCSLCDYAVNSNDLLSKHIAKHTWIDSSEEFSRESNARSKSRSRSSSIDINASPTSFTSTPRKQSSSVHQCDQCPAKCSSRSNFLTHLSFHKNGNQMRYRCSECSFGTRRRDLLQKHLVLHGITRNTYDEPKTEKTTKRKVSQSLQCSHCPETLQNQRDFERHLEKHNNSMRRGSRHKCPKCNFSSFRAASLETHLLCHSSATLEKPVVSTMEWELVDALEKEGIPSIERSKPFSCSKCPFKSPNRADMDKHMKCHSKGNGVHKCSHCDYSSKNLALKLKHEILHQKQIQWKTAHGSYKNYKSKSRIGGVSTYSVTRQQYEEFRKGNPLIKYKAYMKATRNGTRRAIATFKCFKCPYQNPEYAIYVGHQRHHDGLQKGFQCSVCDFSHARIAEIEKHIQLHKNGSYSKQTSTVKTANSNTQVKSDTSTEMKSPVKTPTKPIIQRVMPQTQRSRDTVSWKLSTATVKSFTEQYSTALTDDEQANRTKFLVQRMKVSSFMGIDNFDLATTNILTFQGIGKSASISALLVGLGYDLLLEDHVPEVLCGIYVQDFIQKGAEEATIELSISLHAAPKLQREYGSHLHLVRTLQRGIPLALTTFKVMSADTSERFPKTVEVIGRERIRRIQKDIGMKPDFYRLLLLDEMNLCYLLNETSCWYNFYRLTFESRKEKLESRLHPLRLKLMRLQGEIEWRKQKRDFLELEISKTIMTNESRWRDKDEKELHDLKIELDQMNEIQNELTTGVNSLLNELNKLPNVLTGRLKFRYQEFLHRQDYMGSILVNDKDKTIAVWIVNDKQSVIPNTFEDMASLWATTSNDLKRLAVIDAASTRSTEFSIPSTAFPLLFELIEKKCSQGHQFVASLLDEEDAFNTSGA